MNGPSDAHMDSRTLGDFAKVLQQENTLPLSGVQTGGLQGNRLHLDGEKVKNGLGQLVLTLVKLVHELLEQQAIRRIEGGSLSEREIERLGLALMQQGQEIDRLRKEFGLEEDDLNLDLGPLGRLF
jgi:hypothetical protein